MRSTDVSPDCNHCENLHSRIQELSTELARQKGFTNQYKAAHAKAKLREEEARAQLAEFKRANRDTAKLSRTIKTLESRLSALGVEGKTNPLRRIGEENKRLKKQIKEYEKHIRDLEEKVESLEQECQKLKTQNTRLSRCVYEKKNESRGRGSSSKDKGREKKQRKAGNGRRQREGLEQTVENKEVSACCEVCGKPFVSNGWEESSTIEVEVKAHKRIIRRQRCRGTCECSEGREVVAEAPARLFPHSEYGISVWAMYLYQRFCAHQTLGGTARWFENAGVEVPKGTLGSRDRAFVEIFNPVAAAIAEHLREEEVVHGDETGWRVMKFAQTKGNTRAWLWICASEHAVLVNIDESRSAAAGLLLFGGLGKPGAIQYLVSDRYRSYNVISRETGLVLAYCWAHARRDFIDISAADKKIRRWADKWISRIGNLYKMNELRNRCFDKDTQVRRKGYEHRQRRLEEEVEKFFGMVEKELERTAESSPKHQPLSSLISHREGLSVFVGAPQVPMDNNLAERGIRPAVITRKIAYGSQSEGGAQLMSCLYSVMETLRINGINTYRWLVDYLEACAANGGEPPRSLSEFLPWTMSEERLGDMSIDPRGMGP